MAKQADTRGELVLCMDEEASLHVQTVSTDEAYFAKIERLSKWEGGAK